MKNSNELIHRLNSDIKSLENKIEYRHLYNLRNTAVRLLLKSGIFIEYAFPFLLSSMIISSVWNSKTPFIIDEVIEKANVETIDTSSGIHFENISYDFDYDDESIEYSTGWLLNDDGLYERTVTSYRVNNKIDLADTKEIMAMTKEELEQVVDILDIKTIKKKSLIPEDVIYNSDSIIVINHFESNDIFCIRSETFIENSLDTILYLLASFGIGFFIKIVGKKIIKIQIKDKLLEFEPLFRNISGDELEAMKGILHLKKENLELLNSECDNLGENQGYSYKLRRM